MLLLGKIPDLAKCFENPQRSQRCIVRIISEETDLSKTPTTKVHSEKSKSRDRLVQKETEEKAWGDAHEGLEIVEGKKSVPRNRRSGLGIVEKSLPGPRICRPGVEIVEKNLSGPRNRRPGRGIVDRVRGFVDQGLKSSTRSETSSTGSEDLSTRSGNRREKSIGSEESSTRTRNRRPGPRICRPGVEIVDQVRDFIDRVRGFVDQVRDFIDRVRGVVEGLSTRTRNRRPGPRICRPGVEIVDQVRDFIDRVRGIVDQDDEWSMKIYRVRGMVDQGLKSSTRSETSSTVSEEWSRICRPGVEIVDRDREFVDQDGGMLDQDDEWAMKIYRDRGMAHPLSSPMVVRSLGLDSDSFDPKKDEEEVLGPEVPYLSAIGALMYLASHTRPDICFAVNLLCLNLVHDQPKGTGKAVFFKTQLLQHQRPSYLKTTQPVIAQLKDSYIKGDRTKHILPKFFFTHDLQRDGEVRVVQVRSSDNSADLFTKALPTSTLRKLTHQIGMRRLKDLQG
ncbi:hypothetical protein ISN44_Un184g000040 [Arabidopsis suecica]|uniref:Uncharacterized protein n=1 Tax=Arabidopsis suecica TaxID=45249 RepID=A0A8T1XH59_ARASU|nr:hypothetical protein ISN44_Un184g000040 [Arabidopsis suecica]